MKPWPSLKCLHQATFTVGSLFPRFKKKKIAITFVYLWDRACVCSMWVRRSEDSLREHVLAFQ